MTILAAKYWLLDRPAVYPKPFPPVPTRDQVCSVQMSFQGLTVDLGTGPIGWFEGALCCLTPAQRRIVYAAKHLAGDTHAIIEVQHGGPLYPEPDQPYADFQCPDYTTDHAALEAITEEIIRAGFIPCLFMKEDTAEVSTDLIQIAVNVLRTAAVGDLTQYAIFMPGYDGVFYGWAPPNITNWDVIARANGARYLGIEHNTGHIPLGNGPGDYAGGAMSGFDVILSEFDPWGQPGFPAQAGDTVWQIADRLLGPAFVRPPEMGGGDDPHPPWYLASGSDRGPYFAVAFETDTYWWVRNRVSLADVERKRVYFYKLGYRWVC